MINIFLLGGGKRSYIAIDVRPCLFLLRYIQPYLPLYPWKTIITCFVQPFLHHGREQGKGVMAGIGKIHTFDKLPLTDVGPEELDQMLVMFLRLLRR